MEPEWDYEALRAWFSVRPGEDVAETDLLNAFFPGEDVFAEGVGLGLFHKHFLLYRRLWLFDDELRLSTGERLWIRGIRSTLLPAPPGGRCGWLDPDTGLYCLADTPTGSCTAHGSTAPEPNSMKSYYLDWKNLEGMTEEGLQSLVAGFFRWMGAQGGIAQALETLGLPPEADAKTIKARWHRLSLEHHPDRGGDPAVFKKMSAAWAALKSIL